jgi:hypothetical protein
MNKFTHLATVYGIPIYYNKESGLIKGVNKFYDILINFCILFEVLLDLEIYKVKSLKELSPDNLYH